MVVEVAGVVVVVVGGNAVVGIGVGVATAVVGGNAVVGIGVGVATAVVGGNAVVGIGVGFVGSGAQASVFTRSSGSSAAVAPPGSRYKLDVRATTSSQWLDEVEAVA